MTPRFDPDSPAFTRSYQDLRPKLDLITSDATLQIRHDIEASVLLALGVASAVARYREEARAQLDERAAEAFDLLGPAAQACGRAHADHQVALHGADLESMAGSLSDVRAVLRLEAIALVQGKVMPGSVLQELKGGTGYRDLAFDVLQLASVFRGRWAEVEAHTALAMVEIDRAEAAANAFLTTLAENQQRVGTSPSADIRRRAYTFLVRTYEEVRRAMTFLRWDAGDVDELVPPLSSGRSRNKADEEEPSVPPAPTTEARPGMPGAPALGPTT